MLGLLLSAACATADDSASPASADTEGPLAGPWSGTLAGAWTTAGGAAATSEAEVTAWIRGSDEVSSTSLYLRGTTEIAGTEGALAGRVDVRIDTPATNEAQPLVRQYGRSGGEPADDPCERLEVADNRAFVCPFAPGDAWTWDGADTIDQAWSGAEGTSTLVLHRQPVAP